MKNIIFMMTTFICLNVFSQYEQFNIGVSGGVTIGNIEDRSGLAFGADVNYLFDINEQFYLGPSVNLVYFTPREIDGFKPDPLIYLPVGGAVRFQRFDDPFCVGADFGFAIGISPDGDRGGIFFRPMVGYNVTDNIKLNLFYSGVKKKQPTYGFIGLGIAVDLFVSDNYYSF